MRVDPVTKAGAIDAVMLPEVTLVAVTSIAIGATVTALRKSMGQVRFARTVLLSDRAPDSLGQLGIEWQPIPPIRSRADYSAFMLHDLADYVETSHVLCVQWDGFVLDGSAWDPRFLEFDYIGAIWPHFDDRHNVGNGGFSLRSKRLLEATRQLPYDGAEAEDVLIGRSHRDQLEAQGIRFAPEELAREFAYERTQPTGREFGFHGVFNLANLITPAELSTLLRSLEPQVLHRSEHKELLRSVVRKGYFRMALLIIWRILQQEWSRRLQGVSKYGPDCR